MIFVSYGTEEFLFERLTSNIHSIINNNKYHKEEFVLQMGQSYNKKYNSNKNVIAFRYCTNDSFNKYVEDARIIITHGGVGSIITALSRGKIPIVIPRYKKYGEQVDDHQTQIVNEFSTKNYIISFSENSQLEYLLDNYDAIIKHLNKYVHEDSSISRYINEKYFT